MAKSIRSATLTVSNLNNALDELVEWEKFAWNLKGITQKHIDIVKRDNTTISQQKSAILDKWIRVCPDASWKDVVTALEKAEENALAQKVTHKYCSNIVVTNLHVNKDVTVVTGRHVGGQTERDSGRETTSMPTTENDQLPLPISETQQQGEGKTITLMVGRTQIGMFTNSAVHVERIIVLEEERLRLQYAMEEKKLQLEEKKFQLKKKGLEERKEQMQVEERKEIMRILEVKEKEWQETEKELKREIEELKKIVDGLKKDERETEKHEYQGNENSGRVKEIVEECREIFLQFENKIDEMRKHLNNQK